MQPNSPISTPRPEGPDDKQLHVLPSVVSKIHRMKALNERAPPFTTARYGLPLQEAAQPSNVIEEPVVDSLITNPGADES